VGIFCYQTREVKQFLDHVFLALQVGIVHCVFLALQVGMVDHVFLALWEGIGQYPRIDIVEG